MSEPNSGPPTEPVDSAVGILVAQEGAAHDRIAENLLAALLSLWASFSLFYTGAAVAALGQRMAQIVLMAQRSSARVTEVHLRMQMRQMGIDLPAQPIVEIPEDLRLGAETADVYQRPVRQVRYLRSEGVALQEAVEQATERLEKIALSDLQLARNTAAQQIMTSLPDETPVGPVRGYRRIIHPELGNVCGLCIAASDRVYHKRELLPLHPACKCTVIPIIGDKDPGGKLNEEDLTLIYEAAGGTTASRALSRTRFEVRRNGELGPILIPAEYAMKGPRQVKEQMSDRAKELRRQQLEKQIAELKSRKNLSQWHQDRLDQLEELFSAA